MASYLPFAFPELPVSAYPKLKTCLFAGINKLVNPLLCNVEFVAKLACCSVESFKLSPQPFAFLYFM